MTLSSYFPQNYLQDYKTYKEKVGDVLCGHMIPKIEKLEEGAFIDGKLFFLVSYQLNLLNQLFYVYFKDESSFLQSKLPEFVDCRCFHQGGPPQTIIRNLARWKKGRVKYSESDLLGVCEYFKGDFAERFSDIPEEKMKEILDRVEVVSQECLEDVRKYLK